MTEFLKCISASNVIQAITAIATLILAYMAYKQISYLRSDQKPIMTVVRLNYNEYFLFNYGKSSAYEIFVQFNEYREFAPVALEASKHLLLFISPDLMPDDSKSTIPWKTNLAIFFKHRFSDKHEKQVCDLSTLTELKRTRVTDELVRNIACSIKILP